MKGSPAITRNRMALLAIVAAIAALLGGRGAGLVARGLRNAALALLRPAEAAARRLIVIAARGLVVAHAARPFVPGVFGKGASTTPRLPAFRLFDPRKRFALRRNTPTQTIAGIPRIRSFWGPSALPPPPPISRRAPQPLIDVSRLHLRLKSLETALNDLPAQARRLARWRARTGANPSKRQRQPLRLGQPPGFRQNPDRDVDYVLRECHTMALAALVPDTS